MLRQWGPELSILETQHIRVRRGRPGIFRVQPPRFADKDQEAGRGGETCPRTPAGPEKNPDGLRESTRCSPQAQALQWTLEQHGAWIHLHTFFFFFQLTHVIQMVLFKGQL